MAFDCLWVASTDLRGHMFTIRRDHLEHVLDGQDMLLPARRLADDGLKAWRQVMECGYEGLIAKDPSSPTRVAELYPGSRSRFPITGRVSAGGKDVDVTSDLPKRFRCSPVGGCVATWEP